MKKNKLILPLLIVALSSCEISNTSNNDSDSIIHQELSEIEIDGMIISNDMSGYEVYNLLSKDDKKSFFNIKQFNFEIGFIANDESINLKSTGFAGMGKLPTDLGEKNIDYFNVNTTNNLSPKNDISRYVRFDNSTILNEKIGNYSTLYSMGEIYFLNDEIKAMSGQVISETGEKHTYISDNIPMFLPNDQPANDFYLPSRIYSTILTDLYTNCFSDEYVDYQTYDFTIYSDYIELNISNEYGIITPVIDFDILLKQNNYFNCNIHINTSTLRVENISFELKSHHIAHSMYQGVLKASLLRTYYSDVELDEMVNKELEFLKNNI